MCSHRGPRTFVDVNLVTGSTNWLTFWRLRNVDVLLTAACCYNAVKCWLKNFDARRHTCDDIRSLSHVAPPYAYAYAYVFVCVRCSWKRAHSPAECVNVNVFLVRLVSGYMWRGKPFFNVYATGGGLTKITHVEPVSRDDLATPVSVSCRTTVTRHHRCWKKDPALWFWRGNEF